MKGGFMSQGKSKTGVVIGILVFALIATVVAWFLFSNPQNNDLPQAPAAGEILPEGDVTGEETGDQSSLEQDEVPLARRQSPSAPTAQTVPGEPGEVEEVAVDPVLGTRALGDPNAPVKIEEFFSLTCNHCADFHTGTFQALKRDYIDQGQVYFVFREFPLNGPALYGSMIARCLPEDRYADFVALLLREQDQWAFGGDFRGSLKRNATLAGMSEEEFEQCFSNSELQMAIAEGISQATEAYNIRSTPSFVFNDGERILRGSNPIDAFEQIITFLNNDENSAAATDAEGAAAIAPAAGEGEGELPQIIFE
jgi:protein-disulfide isomerase